MKEINNVMWGAYIRGFSHVKTILYGKIILGGQKYYKISNLTKSEDV